MRANIFKEYAEKIARDKFLSNSFIFFIGGFLASVGNYFFHFLMVRLLSVESYGELQSLLAASVIFSIPISALLVVLVRYSAHFRAKGETGKIYSLFSLFTKRILFGVLIFSFVFVALSGYIASFLKLSSFWPVVILGASFLPMFLATINRGIIQGLEKFASVSIVSIIETFSKILFGFLLVRIGWALNGALGAIVLSCLVGYLVAFLPLRFLFSCENKKSAIETKEMFRYFFPAFFALLFLNLFYNLDIILVKHFLPAFAAGQYGAMALIGHIIFFIVGPLASVMFPMTAAAHANQSNPSKILKKTIILTTLLGSAILLFYFLTPGFIIEILVGKKFLPIGNLLGWFGLAMFAYSLIMIFSQYFLSTHQTKCFYLLGMGIFLQTILMLIWHQNLGQIVWAMNITMFATLISLLIFYFKTNKRYA